MSHIIGRPNDDLLDVILGPGADPEQAFIGGSEQGLEAGDGFEDRMRADEPTVPELSGWAFPACVGWAARPFVFEQLPPGPRPAV